MIDRMASDLGICRFIEEPFSQYKCRVVYSAMACWMKAIALDRTVGCYEKEPSGVSRRHIYERSHSILEMMIKMMPEIGEWFNMSEDNEDPVYIIRTRLINHGDLLSTGFNTDLALSSVRSNQLTPTIEEVFGKTIDKDLIYSGVASIRHKEMNEYVPEIENVKEWMKAYLNEASWFHDVPDPAQTQYFNPSSHEKNNYLAWQDTTWGLSDKIILIRTVVNRNSHAYYLLKPKEKLTHRIDPFLQDLGFHIRIMCALRSQSKNNTTVNLTNYTDHIKIKLNALLPMQERIMMESYAWPVRRINDKLEWVMSYSIWNHIKLYLEALDIQIVEVKHG